MAWLFALMGWLVALIDTYAFGTLYALLAVCLLYLIRLIPIPNVVSALDLVIRILLHIAPACLIYLDAKALGTQRYVRFGMPVVFAVCYLCFPVIGLL